MNVLLAEDPLCPNSATFFGFMGVTAALVFCNLGSSYGTAKSGVGIASMGVMRPELVMRNVMPVIMAGILGIYGLIVGAILIGRITEPTAAGNHYTSYAGFAHLASGLCVGLACLSAGIAIGIVGDAGVRAIGQNERLFVPVLLIMIFAEALALYGLIVSLILGLTGDFQCNTA